MEDMDLVLSLEKQKHLTSEEDMEVQIEEAQEEYKSKAEIYLDASLSDSQANDKDGRCY